MNTPAQIYRLQPRRGKRKTTPTEFIRGAEVISITTRWGCDWGLF